MTTCFNSGRVALLADWNWQRWLNSIPFPNSRGAVITFCIGVICVSLFIMMKKFSSDDRARRI